MTIKGDYFNCTRINAILSTAACFKNQTVKGSTCWKCKEHEIYHITRIDIHEHLKSSVGKPKLPYSICNKRSPL